MEKLLEPPRAFSWFVFAWREIWQPVNLKWTKNKVNKNTQHYSVNSDGQLHLNFVCFLGKVWKSKDTAPENCYRHTPKVARPPTKPPIHRWLKTRTNSCVLCCVSAGAAERISRDRSWQLVIKLLKQASASPLNMTFPTFLFPKRSSTDSLRLQTAAVFVKVAVRK